MGSNAVVSQGLAVCSPELMKGRKGINLIDGLFSIVLMLFTKKACKHSRAVTIGVAISLENEVK